MVCFLNVCLLDKKKNPCPLSPGKSHHIWRPELGHIPLPSTTQVPGEQEYRNSLWVGQICLKAHGKWAVLELQRYNGEKDACLALSCPELDPQQCIPWAPIGVNPEHRGRNKSWKTQGVPHSPSLQRRKWTILPAKDGKRMLAESPAVSVPLSHPSLSTADCSAVEPANSPLLQTSVVLF